MAFPKALTTFGAGILSILLYFLLIGYRKRSRINELRKQGVVSTLSGAQWFILLFP